MCHILFIISVLSLQVNPADLEMALCCKRTLTKGGSNISPLRCIFRHLHVQCTLYTHLRTHSLTHQHAQIHVHTHTHTHTHTHKHAHTHTHTHTHTQTHTHTYTHTHTHTCMTAHSKCASLIYHCLSLSSTATARDAFVKGI